MSRVAASKEVDHFPKAPLSYKASHSKTMALDRSRVNILHATNVNLNQMKILWSQAEKCPLYLQKREQKLDEMGNKMPFPKHTKSGKEMKFRSNRALSGHTLKTMASGAAATIGAQLASDCAMLRTRSLKTPPEDPKYPFMPTFSLGASLQIEGAYIAYMQELFHTAVVIKDAVGKHKKVTARGCQVAADIVNSKIAAATGFVPKTLALRKVVGLTIKKTRRKESKESKAKTSSAKLGLLPK